MTIAETEEEIVEEFELFDNWEERYEYIIDMGKKLLPLEDQFKKEENVIKGCQSTVWLVAEYKDHKILFRADSEAIIVKGLVSMLIRVLSGHSPDDILAAKLEFIDRIGMKNHLAQTRSNGLASMVRQMKNYALAFKMKNQN